MHLLSIYLCLASHALLRVAGQGSPLDYAPNTNVSCPDIATDPLIREFTAQNQSIHPQEQAYISARESQVIPAAWSDWLGDGSGISYNLSQFEGHFSRIGIAVSGGGFRAAQYGAGVLSGLDARNESAKSAGTGGLLQVTSYLAGLSGGSWLTGSFYFNDFPTIKDMVYGNGGNLTGWLLDLNLISPDGVNVFDEDNQDFFGSILWSVIAKANKGVDTSVTDPWARMISYHFLNQTTRQNFFTNETAHGAGQLWSNIPQIPSFKNLLMPFPIVITNSRPANSNSTAVLALEPTVYEITPLEFGSYDPNLSAMVNLTYAGTHLANGQPPNSTGCVTAFDQAGFVMGSSASLFNQILDIATNTLNQFTSTDLSSLTYVLTRQLRSVRTRADDVANWPNPFNLIKPTTFEDSNSTWLSLIDGSSNLENLPLTPMFVRSREIDVVVAVDGSQDEPVNSWPNATSLIISALRLSTILQTSHQQFPPIPATADDFISTGVNQRPAFFGCNPQQIPPEYPLVIYFPNSPPLNGDVPVTNTPTSKVSYTQKHTNIFLEQVHANTIGGFTPNSNAPDPNFGSCLKCAAIDRSRLKLTTIIPRSALCAQCFQQYCYDPQNPPSAVELPGRNQVFVDPDPTGVAQVSGFLANEKAPLIGGLLGLLILTGTLVGFLIWWRKRQDRKRGAQYNRVSDLHQGDAPWVNYSDRAEGLSYELSDHADSSLSPATSTTKHSEQTLS